jgi:hypothetical protein
VLVARRRDAAAALRFFQRALTTLKVTPTEVVTDAAPVYPAVLDELMPSAWHHVEQYANNPIEADHGQLKHRLRPMRGLRTDRTAQTIIAGHAGQDPADRAGTDPVAEAAQFALDPAVAPARVLPRQLQDRDVDLGGDRRPAGAAWLGPAAWPG